jgi:two-component system, cell cycle sensor histidine kinase and response regulator CckA
MNKGQRRMYSPKQFRVLVVDDNELVHRVCEKCLNGLEIFEAEDGASALFIASERNGAIDLLVTDVLLPDCNGFELGETFRVRWPEMKVLFISGSHRPTFELEPGSAFLPKPFTLAEFRKSVSTLLSIPNG